MKTLCHPQSYDLSEIHFVLFEASRSLLCEGWAQSMGTNDGHEGASVQGCKR